MLVDEQYTQFVTNEQSINEQDPLFKAYPFSQEVHVEGENWSHVTQLLGQGLHVNTVLFK